MPDTAPSTPFAPADAPALPPGLRRAGLWLLAAWTGMALVAGLALWQLRENAVDSQMRELGLLSLALTDEIDRGLRGAEGGLQALRGELRDGLLPAEGTLAATALRSRADLMPMVRALWLVDQDRRLMVASDPAPLPDLSQFSPGLERLGREGAALSRPFLDPNTRLPLVAMALPYELGPTGPRGWLVAALPARELLGAFSVVAPADDARMLVIRRDGVVLANTRSDPMPLSEAQLAARIADRPTLERRQFRDGREYLIGLHTVQRYDIKVLVARDLEAVLSPWRASAGLAGAALGLLLLGMGGALWTVHRANRRRLAAQQALAAQIARASRLESLGTLAGGVAHDFNNVLAGILGYGEMAQDAAAPGSAQARHLGKVMQAALRGKALVERILAFSRGGAQAATTVFELEAVVREVLALLAGSLPPGVRLLPELHAPGGSLRGDPTQAYEAVMNLCTNALQAMPQGGTLRVRMRRLQQGAPVVLSHSALATGDYLVLAVEDDGPGISPAVMERLFEPFFTTRRSQSGTGLGLAVVHGVVSAFGGGIDVCNRPGHGACFTLYLPACAASVVTPPPAADAPLAGRGQAIAVVDDQPELVALTVETLTALGYAPVGFDAPAAALAAIQAEPGRFAALVTDEVMPELAGTALCQRVRAVATRLPVLLVTGYGGAQLSERAAAAGVSRVLGKPVQRAELARALADLLA